MKMGAQADEWLGSKDGHRALKQAMLRNLLINLQIEQEEGQVRAETPQGKTAARLSRQKYEKTSELVMMLVRELEQENR